MRIIEITTKDSDLSEAPAGMFKQGLKKLGAKAAGAIGMKGTAAGLAQSADTGDQANKLKVDLKGYLGGTGGSLKSLDAEELKGFLASKKMPTTMVPASGIVPPKELDNIILKTIQQSKKVKGAPAVGAKPNAGAIGSGTAPAGGGAPASAGGGAGAPTGQAQGGGQAPAQGGQAPAQAGQAPAPNDANNDGKDDTTGKVIPMNKKAAGGGTVSGAGASEIPAELQAQIDQLTPTEKKALAGII